MTSNKKDAHVEVDIVDVPPVKERDTKDYFEATTDDFKVKQVRSTVISSLPQYLSAPPFFLFHHHFSLLSLSLKKKKKG